jgi:hypothetical protein
MPLVIVNPNCPPTPVDDFPAGIERSREGSLLVRPLGTMVVTEEELAHIQQHHPALYRHFTVPAAAQAPAHAADARMKKAAAKAAEAKPRKKVSDAQVPRIAELVRSGSLKIESVPVEIRAAVSEALKPPSKPARSEVAAEPAPAPEPAPSKSKRSSS